MQTDLGQETTKSTQSFPETRMLRLQRVVRSKYGVSILMLIAVVESFLPVPILTDPFLAGAILVDRTRAVYLVVVTLISSVIGGVMAFAMAVFFKDWLLSIASPEMTAVLDSLLLEGQGTLLLTLVGAITPIPYTIVAWAVALSAGSPLVFIIGSLVGRGVRYGIVGWCTYLFGPLALRYARKSIAITSIAVIGLFVIYILLKM